MTTSIEVHRRIAELREKGRAGTMTLDDCREAIAFLRADRLNMPTKAASSRTKAPPPDANDLLSELGL